MNWLTTLSFDVEIRLKDHEEKRKFIDLSAGCQITKAPVNSSIRRFRAELALYKVKTKQRKKGGGELVHHDRI